MRGNLLHFYLSFANMATPTRYARVLSACDIVVGLSCIKTILGTFELNHVSLEKRESAYQ